MLSVKGPGDSIVKGTELQIVCQHRRPCDRLKQSPMGAESGNERKNNEDFAKP